MENFYTGCGMMEKAKAFVYIIVGTAIVSYLVSETIKWCWGV